MIRDDLKELIKNFEDVFLQNRPGIDPNNYRVGKLVNTSTTWEALSESLLIKKLFRDRIFSK